MTKLKTLMFFENGCLACFDDKGQQVPELQDAYITLWIQKAQSIGFNVDDLQEIIMPDGRQVKLIKFQYDDGTTGYNWKHV